MPQENDKADLEFLKETQRFWSKRCDREISLEDAREIQENLFGYINILIEWDEQDKKALIESNQENQPQAKEVSNPDGAGITGEQASKVIQDVLNPKITTDGTNITLSVEWPEDDEDSNTDSNEDIDRLIEFYEDRFGKTLTREEAQEI